MSNKQLADSQFPEDTWTPIPHPFLRRWRIYAGILKRWLIVSASLRPPLVRDRKLVERSYTGLWRGSPASVHPTARERAVRDYRGALYEVPKIAMRKIYLREMSRALGGFGGVESVLELGSGNGINVLSFAALHPEIRVWRGIEMTPEGVAAAGRLREHLPLDKLAYLTGLGREAVGRRLAGRDIKFQQGSILELPFAVRSFDVVFSSLVIEQIPRDYPQAFREARRVARLGGFFIEEFREAQSNVFQRMQLSNLDYFRASYREAERAGWRLQSFERLPMNKIQFSSGLLVCS